MYKALKFSGHPLSLRALTKQALFAGDYGLQGLHIFIPVYTAISYSKYIASLAFHCGLLGTSNEESGAGGKQAKELA
ncbi:hypothetical protein ACET3Z_020967 [Daucus carota]